MASGRGIYEFHNSIPRLRYKRNHPLFPKFPGPTRPEDRAIPRPFIFASVHREHGRLKSRGRAKSNRARQGLNRFACTWKPPARIHYLFLLLLPVVPPTFICRFKPFCVRPSVFSFVSIVVVCTQVFKFSAPRTGCNAGEATGKRETEESAGARETVDSRGKKPRVNAHTDLSGKGDQRGEVVNVGGGRR